MSEVRTKLRGTSNDPAIGNQQLTIAFGAKMLDEHVEWSVRLVTSFG